MGKALVFIVMVGIAGWFGAQWAVQPARPSVEVCKQKMLASERSAVKAAITTNEFGAALLAKKSNLETLAALTELDNTIAKADLRIAQECFELLQK